MIESRVHIFGQQLGGIRELFESNPERARQLLEEMRGTDPAAFRAAIIPVLRQPVPARFRECVKRVLGDGGLLPLCDPGCFSLEEEIAIVRELAGSDPLFEFRLARRISSHAEPMPEESALRLLDLLGEVSMGNRALPMIVGLLQDAQPRLRSKAARLIARSNMAPLTAERLLNEHDPRVRANAVDALIGTDTPLSREVFRDAARDSNNRVAGNALLGLYLVGDSDAIPQILQMAVHPDPLFRATAAWVMARTENPR